MSRGKAVGARLVTSSQGESRRGSRGKAGLVPSEHVEARQLRRVGASPGQVGHGTSGQSGLGRACHVGSRRSEARHGSLGKVFRAGPVSVRLGASVCRQGQAWQSGSVSAGRVGDRSGLFGRGMAGGGLT